MSASRRPAGGRGLQVSCAGSARRRRGAEIASAVIATYIRTQIIVLEFPLDLSPGESAQ